MSQKQDLLALWRKIDAELEADDALTENEMLARCGVATGALPDSINESAARLLEEAFDRQDTDLVNQVFDGKYRILRPLDSGGQSDIYLAERADGVYEKTVVVKFMSRRVDYQQLAAQFRREMQMLADLDHPGVVSILDGNITEGGQPWLALDFIEGPHVDEYCRDKQLGTKQIVELIADLCETLEFVHRRNILHLDIKPANVLIKQINDVPFPVLIDFGIANSGREGNPDQDAIFGTLGYSAPEQLQGLGVDLRADIYATGVLLASLLSRSPGRNDRGQLIAQLRDTGIPDDLVHIVRTCLADDPNKRYQSADALRTDLNNWLRGLPISSRTHQIRYVAGKALFRHRYLVAAVAVVVLAALAFGVRYTRDISHLQKLTAAEKNASDELLNFMLDDLYEKLDRIGRIDVLQPVAERSVAHLEAQDPRTQGIESRVQAVKAYINAGRVFERLEQPARAQALYEQAEAQLQIVAAYPEMQTTHKKLLAFLRVHQAQVLLTDEQQVRKLDVLQQAIEASSDLSGTDDSAEVLWEARIELGYHHLEYAEPERAMAQISAAIELASSQAQADTNSAQWQYHLSHSYQLMAWHAIDYGDIADGTDSIQTALVHAQSAIELDPDDLKKQNNRRILMNQLAFFLLEQGEIEAAQPWALKAIEAGEQLALKAPLNEKFRREHASSLTTAGDIMRMLDQTAIATTYYQRSLAISRQVYAQDTATFQPPTTWLLTACWSAACCRKVAARTKHGRFMRTLSA